MKQQEREGKIVQLLKKIEYIIHEIEKEKKEVANKNIATIWDYFIKFLEIVILKKIAYHVCMKENKCYLESIITQADINMGGIQATYEIEKVSQEKLKEIKRNMFDVLYEFYITITKMKNNEVEVEIEKLINYASNNAKQSKLGISFYTKDVVKKTINNYEIFKKPYFMWYVFVLGWKNIGDNIKFTVKEIAQTLEKKHGLEVRKYKDLNVAERNIAIFVYMIKKYITHTYEYVDAINIKPNKENIISYLEKNGSEKKYEEEKYKVINAGIIEWIKEVKQKERKELLMILETTRSMRAKKIKNIDKQKQQ